VLFFMTDSLRPKATLECLKVRQGSDGLSCLLKVTQAKVDRNKNFTKELAEIQSKHHTQSCANFDTMKLALAPSAEDQLSEE